MCCDLGVALQGNPFCLQPGYFKRVCQSLPLLLYFDGKRVSWTAATPAMELSDAAHTNSHADVASPTASVQMQPQLQVSFSQLSVANTVPGRLPGADSASEPCPPMYFYYMQLRAADGSAVCSFPTVLTPQDEVSLWQAKQSAEPAAASKKPAKKAPAAAKGARADAEIAQPCNAWYPEVSLPTSPDSQQMRLDPPCTVSRVPYKVAAICFYYFLDSHKQLTTCPA